LKNTIDKLTNIGFDVLIQNKVPTNDGGLAFGQAMIASQIILDR
jgi:hydrogenase maturation factor HypF (carbamoyltransferase family)